MVLQVPRHPFIYYFKNLLPSLVLCTVVQIISAGIFVAIESKPEYIDHADGTPCIPSEPTNTEGFTCAMGRRPWTYADALYYCVVTATTVGYGDVRISTQEGRLWATFYMVVSCALVCDLLYTISMLSKERTQIFSRINMWRRRIDDDLFMKLMERAKEMFPDTNHEEKGFTEYEFAMLMITVLDMVPWTDVKVFVKQFRTFDTGRRGMLHYEEIAQKLSGDWAARGANGGDIITLYADIAGDEAAGGASGGNISAVQLAGGYKHEVGVCNNGDKAGEADDGATEGDQPAEATSAGGDDMRGVQLAEHWQRSATSAPPTRCDTSRLTQMGVRIIFMYSVLLSCAERSFRKPNPCL
jgi:hypothetical protein